MAESENNNSLGKVTKADYHNIAFQSQKDILANTFVIIPLSDVKYLFGRIDGADAGDGHVLYRVNVLALCDGVNGSLRIDLPERIARIGSDVYLSDRDTVTTGLGFNLDPSKSLLVGYMRDLPAMLGPGSLNRHFFVGGVTGSGKSYFGSVMLEELTKLGVPAVIIDAQNDYGEEAESLGGKVVRPGVNFMVPLSSLTTDEAVFMVAALKGTPGYELFRFSFNFLRQGVNQGGKLKTFTLQNLLKQMEQDGMNALRMEGWDFRVAITRVESSITRHRFIGVMNYGFNWSAALQAGKPVVVDCSGLDLLQVQLITAAVMREVQRLRVSGAVPPYMMFLDEAHLLIPAEGDTPCAQVIRENVRIGRHWGAGVVLITQNPLEIDRRVISQCNTRVIFALEPEQLDALRGIKADATEEMIAGIPKFPCGTALLSGTRETVKHAVVIKVRERRTAMA